MCECDEIFLQNIFYKNFVRSWSRTHLLKIIYFFKYMAAKKKAVKKAVKKVAKKPAKKAAKKTVKKGKK